MASTLICKIAHGEEIRRFTDLKDNVTYTIVHDRAKELFAIATPFQFQYKDDEDDMITMSTDVEMAEAVQLAVSREPAVLRLFIKLEGSTNTCQQTDSFSSASAEKTDLPAIFKSLEAGLPDLLKNLPEIASKMAENMAATCHVGMPPMKCRSKCDGFGYGDANVHPGVMCDKSGQCPIVGNRYKHVGQNYDLCEVEFNKLPAEEQAKFVKVPPPFGKVPPPFGKWASPEPKQIPHWGVTCDKSGQSPIVGNRFHLLGHDYDLCEAEFNKLPAEEQDKFEKIPPPTDCRPSCRGWRGTHNGWGHKLAARFVADVAVFDGTEVAPSTPFTKIWRLKNVGECPWPPGTKLLFVGGDQMSAELTVPLTSKMVLPGEEVDVAVDMVAPAELGRYVGYWRLVGPLGRRKFGQRIWAHIQVVDPKATSVTPEEDFYKAEAEITSMLAAARNQEDMDGTDRHEEEAAPSEEQAPAKQIMSDNDEPVVIVKEELLQKPELEVATELLTMGFNDEEIVNAIIEKNGSDLEACTRNLLLLTQSDKILSDLEEMGFKNRSLNKKLMVKYNGSVKYIIKDLIADTAN